MSHVRSRRPRGRLAAVGLLAAAGVALVPAAAAAPPVPTPSPTPSVPAGAPAARTAPTATSGLVVTTVADAGPGSLRQAITTANATPAADRITFRIPGSGPQTIAVATPLPPITAPVTVDGYTQAGSSPNRAAAGSNARPTVEVTGSGTVKGNGLTLAAGSTASTVRGLVINGFAGTVATDDGAGIRIESGRNTIAGNVLGLAPDGETAKSNLTAGVFVVGADNKIGTSAVADRNVVSGNGTGLDLPSPSTVGTAGVYLRGSGATGNVVTNDVVGLSASGKPVFGRAGKLVQGNGVLLEQGATKNVVGAAGRSDVGNVLSGNAQRGVWIQLVGTSFNSVTRNKVGTNLAGTGPVPGAQATGSIQDTGLQISGDARYDGVGVTGSNLNDPTFGNVFAFNDNDGVLLGGTDRAATDLTDGHLIRFNTYRDNGGQDRIGLANNGDAGTAALPSPFEATPGLGTPPFDRNVTNLEEPLDADTGPNNENNLVRLDPTGLENGRAHARGTVNTEPNATFLLDFYSNASPDPSGYGEGEHYVGSGTVRTDALGLGRIDVLLPVDRAVRSGVTITANTTKLSGGASTLLPAGGAGALAGQLTQPPFSTGEFGKNSPVR